MIALANISRSARSFPAPYRPSPRGHGGGKPPPLFEASAAASFHRIGAFPSPYAPYRSLVTGSSGAVCVEPPRTAAVAGLSGLLHLRNLAAASITGNGAIPFPSRRPASVPWLLLGYGRFAAEGSRSLRRRPMRLEWAAF